MSEPDDAAAETQPGTGLDGFAGDPNFMLSLARGLAELGALESERRHLTVSEAAAVTGLPRAVVRRCFYTLEKLGYVGASKPGAFAMGLPLLEMGQAYLSTIGSAGAIQAILDRLSVELHETCALAKLHGHDLVYVASSKAKHEKAIGGQPGTKIPAFCTAMGRVLLAHLSRQELDAYFAQLKPISFTSYTATDPAVIRRGVEHARAAGYSINDQELDIGIRAVAVPVLDRSGRAIAALNVGGDPARLNNSALLARFVPQMNTAAREIGRLVDAF
jgi:IclR family pca regulon transcriptional regulator